MKRTELNYPMLETLENREWAIIKIDGTVEIHTLPEEITSQEQFLELADKQFDDESLLKTDLAIFGRSFVGVVNVNYMTVVDEEKNTVATFLSRSLRSSITWPNSLRGNVLIIASNVWNSLEE